MCPGHQLQENYNPWTPAARDQCALDTSCKRTIIHGHQLQETNVPWTPAARDQCALDTSCKRPIIHGHQLQETFNPWTPAARDQCEPDTSCKRTICPGHQLQELSAGAFNLILMCCYVKGNIFIALYLLHVDKKVCHQVSCDNTVRIMWQYHEDHSEREVQLQSQNKNCQARAMPFTFPTNGRNSLELKTEPFIQQLYSQRCTTSFTPDGPTEGCIHRGAQPLSPLMAPLMVAFTEVHNLFHP
ncbi:hypothetical protein Btru_066205 [Bulinus truncatus]|nr:hypothetical protein Btru_066205 [Bulinus truncatus]